MASVEVELPAPAGPHPPPPPPPPSTRRFPDLDRPGPRRGPRPAVAPTVMAALLLGSVYVSRASLLGVLAAAVGLGLFGVRVLARRRIDPIGLWALACLVATAASGIAVGAAPGRSELATFMGQDGRVFVAYVPFLAFATMVTTGVHVERVRTMLRLLVVLAPVTWLGVSAGVVSAYRRHGAFIGLTSSHHAMGMLMGVVAVTLLVAPGHRRRFDLLVGVGAVAMIGVVGSRTSMTGLLFAGGYLFFRTPSVVRRLRMVILVLVALVAILALSGRTASTVRFVTSSEFVDAAAIELSTPESVEDARARVDSGPTSGAEISNVLLRFGLWRTAADEWLRSPVVGIGAWRFNDPYRTYVGVPGVQLATDGQDVHEGFGAHNLALQTMAETGLVGLALLVSPWVALSRRVRRGRLPDPEHKAVIALLFFAVGTTVTSNSLISPALTFPLLAVALTIVRQRGTGPPSPGPGPGDRAEGWWVGAQARRAAAVARRTAAPANRPTVDGPPPPVPALGVGARWRRSAAPSTVAAPPTPPPEVARPERDADGAVDDGRADADRGDGGPGPGAGRNVGVVALRLGAAAVQLVAVVAVGRALGAVVLGQYLVFQAVVRVGATAAAWGHPWTVLRAVAVADARGDGAASRAALATALRSVARALAGLASAAVVLALVAASSVGPGEVPPAAVLACAAALAAMAVSLVVANALKARDRQGAGLLVEFAPQPLAACGVAALSWGLDLDVGIAALGGAMAAAGAIGAAAGLARWRGDDRRRVEAGPVRELALDDGRADRGTAAFGLTNLANVVGNNVLPLLLPLVMALDDVGRLGAALRLTAIPGTIGSGLVSVYAPRFARQWTAGARRALARSLRETQVWMLVLYAPFGLAFVAAPEVLVSVLGPDFEGTANALRILGIAQAVSAVGGIGIMFLSMCRQERVALAVTMASVAVGTGVALAAGAGRGVTGAAVGYAAVLVATNVAALVWSHLGVLRRMPASRSVAGTVTENPFPRSPGGA